MQWRSWACRLMICGWAGLWLATPLPGQENPALLYKRYCAGCHNPENGSSDPDLDALRAMSAAAVLKSMTSGAMASQAEVLSPRQRRILAEWIGRRPAAAPRTLRLDYVHTGNATREQFRREALVREGPWPGPSGRSLDTTGLGVYFFEVREADSDKLLYSRGFSSIFAEWRETAAAKKQSRSFQESVRFPEPAGPVVLLLKRRDQRNVFRPVWSVRLDPAQAVQAPPAPGAGTVWAVLKNGPPAEKVDLLLLGDGYTRAEMSKWHRDARRLVKALFAVSPFRERRRDFNVWAIDTPATESGISHPSEGITRHSPLGTTYGALGSGRYILTFDNRRLRRVAAAAPYEFLAIVANDRRYGGGGIYNLYATVAAGSEFAPYVFVHELGHHIAGLADEYYTSEVAYQGAAHPVEPWEPNVTTDPRAAKWRDLLPPGVPLPTPWPKKAFEKLENQLQARRRELRRRHRPESELEALFRTERRRVSALLATARWAGKVGAFEGADYHSLGFYRPQIDCIMFSRDEIRFCPVCRRAIDRIIDLYAPRPAP